MALLQDVIARGTHAARPAAGSAGVLYFETDTGGVFRDNGTTWDALTVGPAGQLGYAELTSITTTTSTTLVDITALAVTVTIGTRAVLVTAYVPQVFHSVDNGRVVVNIVDVTGGSTLQTAMIASAGASHAQNLVAMARHNPAAGSRSYKCQWSVIDGGTGQLNVVSGQPAFLLVTEL